MASALIRYIIVDAADAAGPATRKRQLVRGGVRRAGQRLRHHGVLRQGEPQVRKLKNMLVTSHDLLLLTSILCGPEIPTDNQSATE